MLSSARSGVVGSHARCPGVWPGWSRRLAACRPHAHAAEAAASSGHDCGGGGGAGVGFGTLRKGFKPQQKKRTPQEAAKPTLSGRDKADVLRETQLDVAKQLAQKSGQSASPPQAASDWIADWKRVDAKVNTYPSERLFTAVGSGGDEFRDAMTAIVEEVVGTKPPVSVRPSSQGRYVSVRVGPVVVQDRDQVLAVFLKMREDKRLKFHL